METRGDGWPLTMRVGRQRGWREGRRMASLCLSAMRVPSQSTEQRPLESPPLRQSSYQPWTLFSSKRLRRTRWQSQPPASKNNTQCPYLVLPFPLFLPRTRVLPFPSQQCKSSPPPELIIDGCIIRRVLPPAPPSAFAFGDNEPSDRKDS